MNMGLRTIQQLASDPSYQSQLKNFLSNDQISLVDSLKETGNDVSHTPPIKEELENAIKAEECEDEFEKEQQAAKLHLISLLDDFCKKENGPFGWDPLENTKRQ